MVNPICCCGCYSGNAFSEWFRGCNKIPNARANKCAAAMDVLLLGREAIAHHVRSAAQRG